jgi:hypothetical protein
MNLHRPRRRPRVSALAAGMLGRNANEDPRPRDDPSDIGLPEIGFAVGFALACAGLWMIWPALAAIFAGATLAALAWKLA